MFLSATGLPEQDLGWRNTGGLCCGSLALSTRPPGFCDCVTLLTKASLRRLPLVADEKLWKSRYVYDEGDDMRLVFEGRAFADILFQTLGS